MSGGSKPTWATLNVYPANRHNRFTAAVVRNKGYGADKNATLVETFRAPADDPLACQQALYDATRYLAACLSLEEVPTP